MRERAVHRCAHLIHLAVPRFTRVHLVGRRAVAADKAFLAILFFHGVHIPYVATAASRRPYAAMGMSENEQDYWGTVSQLDTAVGRVRALLRKYGRAQRTFVSLNADNGPEVSPASGQVRTVPYRP
jgi:arylsulfatase A-like enzyme